jgi:hypothetical protein
LSIFADCNPSKISPESESVKWLSMFLEPSQKAGKIFGNLSIGKKLALQ